MGRIPRLLALTVGCLAAIAAPALAQNFLNGPADPITPGDFRFSASPLEMFGRDRAPDRFGAALRLGYGFDPAFAVEGKAALFDGVSLLGGDAALRLLDGDTRLSLRVGGHQAVIQNAPDSTALDLAATLGTRVTRGLTLYGGGSYSYEFTHERLAPNFSRAYVVPGLQWHVTPRLFVNLEGGVGLNDTSPHYLAGGFSVLLPTGAGSVPGR